MGRRCGNGYHCHSLLYDWWYERCHDDRRYPGSLMIATAVVTFIVSIVMGGGFSNINHTLQSMNEAYLTFPGANGYMPWTYYISNIVLWSFFTMGQPHLFTNSLP